MAEAGEGLLEERQQRRVVGSEEVAEVEARVRAGKAEGEVVGG